jgi:hypothetical protein
MPSASSRRERAASFDRIASRRATRGGAASLHALPLLLPRARAFECWKPVVSSASPLAYYIGLALLSSFSSSDTCTDRWSIEIK